VQQATHSTGIFLDTASLACQDAEESLHAAAGGQGCVKAMAAPMNPQASGDGAIPGDPEYARRLSARFATVEARAQEILSRLRAIETGLGPQIWRGDAADGFTRLLADTGPDLTRLAASYGMASHALATYATELTDAQNAAREAATEANTATETRDGAAADRDSAHLDSDRYAAAAADAQLRMDPVAAQQAEQRRADALQRETTAQTAVEQAEQALQAAQRKADAAAIQRDSAAARCVRELEEACSAGIDTRNLRQNPTAPNGPPPAAAVGSFSLSDLGHAVLDIAGLIPLVGEAADGINAAWYTAEGDYTSAALSAAAMIPGFGVAATAGRLIGRGSDVVRGVDPAPGPHTPLAPQGGLKRHEDAGGHTLDPSKAHVGATDQQILSRLAAEPRRSAVSSYYDRAAAERAASENIATNRTSIQNWLNSNPRINEAFDFDHGSHVGRRAARGTTTTAGIQDVSGSRVVLRPDPSMPEGYRIQTSYPIRSQDVTPSAW
jgi:uncharacterized protein YukE